MPGIISVGSGQGRRGFWVVCKVLCCARYVVYVAVVSFIYFLYAGMKLIAVLQHYQPHI